MTSIRWLAFGQFALGLAVTVSALSAQEKNRNRTDNEALLGVVTTEEKAGVTIAHVLEDSPATKAKLEVGDVLREIAGTKIERATDVDDALRDKAAGDEVAIELLRDKQPQTSSAKLIARASYKGDFLKRQTKQVGFDAPDWWGFAWANTSKKHPAPTRENTRDKVVVFHTFQSW